LEAQLEACEQRRRETEDLLQRRTKELSDAEAYLTLIDDVSPREVVQIIEHINGQISQSASIISKAPEFSFDGPLHATDSEAARTRLEQASFLGSDLLASLNRASSLQSSALVKTALRAGMADYARRVGSSWDVSAVNSPSSIGDAYLKLREKEPQAVAGRWRILARTYTRADDDQVRQASLDDLYNLITDILLVCGTAGGRESILEVVARDFEGELQNITKLALKFQRTAGERIVSCDYTILGAKPSVAFDPAQMEARTVAESTTPPSSTNRVLCTTELGLIAEK
ncbi:hypothetical protein C8Q74DRAFT_1180517, partial [Fomes fomentarius]